MWSHPLSRALPSRRIDETPGPLPTLLPNVLGAKTCRFHAANAVDVPNSTATPLTDSVILVNVLVKASLISSTDETVLPGL